MHDDVTADADADTDCNVVIRHYIALATVVQGSHADHNVPVHNVVNLHVVPEDEAERVHVRVIGVCESLES